MVHLQGVAYSNTRGLRVPHYKIRVHSDTRIEHSADSGLRWVERTNLDPLYAGDNKVDSRRMAGSDGDSGGGVRDFGAVYEYLNEGANHVSLGSVCFNPFKLRKILKKVEL